MLAQDVPMTRLAHSMMTGVSERAQMQSREARYWTKHYILTFEHCRCTIKVSTSSALSLWVGLSLISKHWKSQAVAIWLAHNLHTMGHSVWYSVPTMFPLWKASKYSCRRPASGLQGQSTSKQGLGQYQAIKLRRDAAARPSKQLTAQSANQHSISTAKWSKLGGWDP